MVERPTEPDDVLAELLGGAGVRPRSFERRLNCSHVFVSAGRFTSFST